MIDAPKQLEVALNVTAQTITKRVLLSLAALLVGIVFIGTGPTDETDEDLDINDLNQIRERVVRDLYDSSCKVIDPYRQMQAISKENDGGFGGFYFDDDDPSIVYVYMKDLTKTAEAETAFRAAHARDSRYTQVIPVQDRYSMDELTDWFYTAL